MARETGTVKWFSKEKGYGFIHRDSGEDIFVHHSDIEASGFRTLRQGESVEFEVKVADKGPRAAAVRREGGDEGGAGSGNGARKTQPAAKTEASAPAEPEGTLSAQIKRKIGRFFGSG